MVINTFTLRTNLDPAECMRLLSEQSERQCNMFGYPMWSFQPESAWSTLPIQMNSDGDRFHLSVRRLNGIYWLKGRLLPDPSGCGTRIECQIKASFGVQLAFLGAGILLAAFVPRRSLREILNCSTPEQMHWQFFTIGVAVCVAVVVLGSAFAMTLGDIGILTEFVRVIAQAERA